MSKIIFFFLLIISITKAQQQRSRLINSQSNTYYYGGPQSSASLPSNSRGIYYSEEQPQQVYVPVTPSPASISHTLFPTISPTFLASMFAQHPIHGSDSTFYLNNVTPATSINYAPSASADTISSGIITNTDHLRAPNEVVATNYALASQSNDFSFAPGTLPMPCGYGVNPVPIYNSPYKKCIPNSPLCGWAFTCIFNLDKNGKVISRAFGPNQNI